MMVVHCIHKQEPQLCKTCKENDEIVNRLAEFTDQFGHLPSNEYPNWRWWERLLDVWGEKKPKFRNIDKRNQEIVDHLRQYTEVLSQEYKDQLMPVSNIYHDLRRMLGDE